MSSKRQIRANRANARASTGPKSAAGKARAAQNAFRHGLSISVLDDAKRAPEVEALAGLVAGQGADLELLSLARDIAQAQIDLKRIRNYRRRMVEKAAAQSDSCKTPGRSSETAPETTARRGDGSAAIAREERSRACDEPGTDGAKPVDILSMTVRELAALDRYVRRALSHRKFAIRAFDALGLERGRRRGAGTA